MNSLKEILIRYADFCMYMQENTGKPHKPEFIKYVSDSYGNIDRVVNDENVSGFACKINSTVDEPKLLNDPKNFNFVFENYYVDLSGVSVKKNRVLVNKESTVKRKIKQSKMLERISKQTGRYTPSDKKLPLEHQLLMDWINWIDWDAIESISLKLSNRCEVVRDWLTSELHEWFDIYENVGVKVNQENQMAIWFEFDRSFDKQSLLDMKSDKSYEIKKRYNGYTMVEICITDK